MTKLKMARKSTGTFKLSAGELLDEYILSLEASNRRPKTMTWYVQILDRFFTFLESKGLLKPLDGIGREELRAYILHLQTSKRWPNKPPTGKDTGKLSPASIQGHVRAIKALWGWLAREGHIDENPLSKFPLPKVPQKMLHIMAPGQVEKLLATVDRHTVLGARNYLIILLLYDCGLRVSELIRIKLEELDIGSGLIRVMGKGQKERLVPVSGVTRKEIIRYLAHARPHVCEAESPYLFAMPDGEPISANGVEQFLRRLAGKAGLAGIRCYPHAFRHTFATQFLANGGNVFALKNIMGHSSLETTLKYTHLQPRDLQNQHAHFSPVRNLGIGKTKNIKGCGV
jgi:site-specific recombinase XerD